MLDSAMLRRRRARQKVTPGVGAGLLKM